MNQEYSIDSTMSSPLGVDAISRRAYELWEKEGRPEGSDLRHWLQAEQELRSNPSSDGALAENDSPRNLGADTRPLRGARGAAANNRAIKRGSTAPFGNERNGNATRRKPPSAPVL
jgi:hypothetical protein